MLRLLLLLLTLASAQYTINVDQTSYAADDIILFSWETPEDSAYRLNLLDQGNIYLCTCSGSSFKCYTDDPIASKVDISDESGSVEIKMSDILSIAGNGNYVFQFQAINSQRKSMYAISYTRGWVTLSGMTGSGTASSTGCTVPYPEYQAVPGTGTSTSVSWPSYTLPDEYKTLTGTLLYRVPYTWQKGPTRMASAQPTPGTKVTKTATSRRNPESSWTAFTTYVFTLMPETTLTPDPVSKAIQQPNFVPTLSTTPAGYKPARSTPVLSLPEESSSSSTGNRRRRRWDLV